MLSRAGEVVAVEFDSGLARKLPGQFPGKSLKVVNSDILSFDLYNLPNDYVVVGNIPYYITNKIVRKFTEVSHKPKIAVFLVQKEVAQRLAADSGEMSIVSVAAQSDYEVTLGPVVLAESFTPPPKVNSQVVIMRRRIDSLVPEEIRNDFFRVVKAGYSRKRKKLRSSLSGGLVMEKEDIEQFLKLAGISVNARAQELSIEDWRHLTEAIYD